MRSQSRARCSERWQPEIFIWVGRLNQLGYGGGAVCLLRLVSSIPVGPGGRLERSGQPVAHSAPALRHAGGPQVGDETEPQLRLERG